MEAFCGPAEAHRSFWRATSGRGGRRRRRGFRVGHAEAGLPWSNGLCKWRGWRLGGARERGGPAQSQVGCPTIHRAGGVDVMGRASPLPRLNFVVALLPPPISLSLQYRSQHFKALLSTALGANLAPSPTPIQNRRSLTFSIRPIATPGSRSRGCHMEEYAPPSGPPPPKAPEVPAGWAARWNEQYKEW